MEKIIIRVYDDYATYSHGKKYYKVKKEKLMDFMLNSQYKIKDILIKKEEKDYHTKYTIDSGYNEIEFSFPNSYKDDNMEYIKAFDDIMKKQKTNGRIKIFLAASILAGAFILRKEDIGQNIKTMLIESSDKYAIRQLDKELNIHTCHHHDGEGKTIYPQYDHDCVFNSDKQISIYDRIEEYCHKYLTDDDMFLDSVKTKFNYLNENDLKDADEINLNKEFKKVKTKN